MEFSWNLYIFPRLKTLVPGEAYGWLPPIDDPKLGFGRGNLYHRDAMALLAVLRESPEMSRHFQHFSDFIFIAETGITWQFSCPFLENAGIAACCQGADKESSWGLKVSMDPSQRHSNLGGKRSHVHMCDPNFLIFSVENPVPPGKIICQGFGSRWRARIILT